MMNSFGRTWYMCGNISAAVLWYMTQAKIFFAIFGNQRLCNEIMKSPNLRANIGHEKFGYSKLKRAGHGLCHESCTHAREKP